MGIKVFNHTSGWQKWEIPHEVTDIVVTLRGASSWNQGGSVVTGLLRVPVKTSVLWIQTGEQGRANSQNYGGYQTQGGGGAGGAGNGSGFPGGFSGGGATQIRKDAKDGTILAVAGGAGGPSGDRTGTPAAGFENWNGRGGKGGGADGEHGWPGPSQGTAAKGFANATGGTQSQRGRGGTNANGPIYDGKDAAEGYLARGGAGGSGGGNAAYYGGGGGGGGYHAGGGGQAGTPNFTQKVPGGGGGGGASYVQGLEPGAQMSRGTGVIGDGQVILEWSDPDAANQPPLAPTDVKINGVDEEDELATMALHKVEISAEISDPNQGQKLKLRAVVSSNKNFQPSWTVESPLVHMKSGEEPEEKHTLPVRVGLTIDNLQTNTHYYVQLWAVDEKNARSLEHNAINFWTDRPPGPPELLTPKNRSQMETIQNVLFDWKVVDEDPNTDQRGFELQYATERATEWTTITRWEDSNSEWLTDSTRFRSNTTYKWRVRTRDQSGLIGEWSEVWFFYISGPTTPPLLVAPIRYEAKSSGEPITFQWRYRDPRDETSQFKADIQYRAVNPPGFPPSPWIWMPGVGDAAGGPPGSHMTWTVPEGPFLPNVTYEWQAKTYSTASSNSESEWSESAFFISTPVPGGAVDYSLPDFTTQAPPLGCGVNRVYIYERGGRRLLGEITPCTTIQWTRRRDDISTLNLTTAGFSWDCGERLRDLRSWQHELVVFRDGVRVWEGPVVRIAYHNDHVEIEAKDVMVYLYRRIMRRGYNDSYQTIAGVQIGGRSVVDRASQIAMDALAYDNPNVIEYLTAMSTNNDAKQMRTVYDYSQTAWEQIDDLAATAGLDYTVAGRRIMLWDTHMSIGRLPEMRDGDFSESPIVTEYGMSMANYFAVTNANGVWGAARPPDDQLLDNDWSSPLFGAPRFYGWVEQLASAYGESAEGTEETLTSDDIEKARAKFVDQAKRGIANRWPSPLLVRVPDNSTLNPEITIGINQLIPGVWIPLRATGTLREVSQMQKLDSVTVSQDSTGEKVSVVMSPAPRSRDEDPDSDAAAAEAAG